MQLYFQKLVIGLHFVLDSMVLPDSNFCSGLQKTHTFSNRVRFGRSTSFKVIQRRWFWCQSKARMRLPTA